MGFRFRRSARFGPLRFHFSKAGLSSISIGRPGASLNLPIARSGGPRTTVGIPGSGMSWSHELGRVGGTAAPGAGLPNSRRLRPGQLEQFRRACLETLRGQLFGGESPYRRLWDQQLVSRLLAEPGLGTRRTGWLRCIETPAALEAYLVGARSQDEVKRRSARCLAAAADALQLVEARGW